MSITTHGITAIMLAGFVAVTCLKLSPAASAQVDSQGIASVEREYRGFRFSDGTCETGEAYCAAREPKVWSPEEIAAVRGALDEIAGRPLGEQLVELVQRGGYRVLRRYRYFAPTEAQSDGIYQSNADINANTQLALRTVDLNDGFFLQRGLRDDFSGEPGYSIITFILAHEFVHALEGRLRQHSMTRDFLQLTGFAIKPGTPPTFLYLARSNRETTEWPKFREELSRALMEGNYREAWRIKRIYALQILGGRLPSMTAVASPEEAFAEVGAHLVLDPTARDYLEPRVVEFVTKAISGAPQ